MPAEPQRLLKDLLEAGRLARKVLPRSAQGGDVPSLRDPVAIIEQQHAARLEHLVPLRVARMAQSPFAFFRGTAAIMAHDLRQQPATGEFVVASGDAHIANFGLFATPERRLTFELDDFDEVSTAPWEWDIKRLAASIVLATRERGASDEVAAADAQAAVRMYQSTMAELAAVTSLDRFYKRLNVRMLEDELSREDEAFIDRTLERARRRTSAYLLPRITTLEADGRMQIRDMKASIDLDDLDERTFNLYVRYCGMLLARSHAQSPAAPFIHGYLGTSDVFPSAVARWSLAYAAQVETDYAALLAAVASGHLPAAG